VPIVDIAEASNQLTELVERAAAGEEIVISRGGLPVARLMPLAAPEPPRSFGRMRGKIRIADDFDAPLTGDEWPASTTTA
jgi:prevent-host-death family protein